MKDARCYGCFLSVTETIQRKINQGKFDQPMRCQHCGALFFITKNLKGVNRAARMVLGKSKVNIGVQMDVAPGIHFVCAWDPSHPLNASQVARILSVDLSFVSRLIRRKEFPSAFQKGREWNIPMGEVHMYLLRRAVRH